MKLISSILLTLLIVTAAFAQKDDTSIESPALTFIVNNNGDTNDANPADNICADASGNCTLRAAIQQANISAGNDTITFALASPTTINLTIGQLSITSSITITGTGARNLIVQRSTVAGTANFRIFNISVVAGTVVNISSITIANGNNANDTGSLFGGGIQNTSSGDTLNLADVTITNNTSSFVGGGIYTDSTLNITRSTISFNRTAGGMGLDAGGIAINSGGVVNISNSTISNNQAAAGGGGIFVFGQLTLNNVTISNNTATRGGGVSLGGGSASVRNTIIAANTAPTNPDVTGVFTSRGNNLIGNGTGGSGFINGVNGDQVGTGAAPIDPMLGPLQNNGGQTDTRALLMGSRAIDAGNNCVLTATCPTANPINALTTDQRGTGFPRQTGSNVDIGAFEVSGTGTRAALNLLDFDGDRRADFAVARPTNNNTVNTVFIQRTDGSASAVQFGIPGGDIFNPGDYDGDGRTDLAVFRTSTGTFFVRRSSDNAVIGFRFGLPGDEPLARDYDGDGRTDFAVVRRTGGQLFWFINNSSNGVVRSVQFGLATDVAVPGDYDGDGRFDIAVFRGSGPNNSGPATFIVMRSSGGITFQQFGLGSDLVVPGDYDGDGRTDFAVVRTGSSYQWYILRSSNNTVQFVQFGGKPQLTVQNDYDGDGRTDVAVFDPRNGFYYFVRSSNGTIGQVAFGRNGDYPIANYDTH
jgi:hypothetical protein